MGKVDGIVGGEFVKPWRLPKPRLFGLALRVFVGFHRVWDAEGLRAGATARETAGGCYLNRRLGRFTHAILIVDAIAMPEKH